MGSDKKPPLFSKDFLTQHTHIQTKKRSSYFFLPVLFCYVLPENLWFCGKRLAAWGGATGGLLFGFHGGPFSFRICTGR